MANEDQNNDKLISQALPVADIRNIDLKAPPATGEEYLYRVRLEASAESNFVVADVDTKKYENKRTPQYISFEGNFKTDKNLKASTEWQIEKFNEFNRLVQRSKEEKNEFLKNNPQTKFIFPKKKSEWFQFCFGKPLKKSLKEPIKEEKTAHKPLLSIMYKMNQVTIVQLLEYQVEWFEEFGYSNEAFEWIYALMLFLEKPLLPESCSSLRGLARKCIEFRSNLESNQDERLIPFNLFISIIGRYFEQYDLIDKED